MYSIWQQLYPSVKSMQRVLLVCFTLFTILGVFIVIPNAWALAWQEGGAGYALFSTVLEPLGVANHSVIYLVLLGIFLGSSALWVLDVFRRYASIVVWAAIVVAAVLWWTEWTISFSSGLITEIIFLTIGIISGLQLGGLPVIQRSEALLPRRRTNLRFTNAVRITLIYLVGLSLVGFIDQHLVINDGVIGWENTGWAPLHLLGIALITGPVAYFQRYKDTERIIQLGPAKSGKTSMQGGLYMSAGETVVDRRSKLLERIYQQYMQLGEFPDRTEIASTAEYTSVVPVKQAREQPGSQNGNASTGPENALIVEFAYITNDILFPKEKVITTVDYPGEILTGRKTDEDDEGIAAYVQKQAESGTYGNWTETMNALRQGEQGMVQDEIESDELRRYLASLVHNADVIMFTIPLDDFITPIVADDARRSNVKEYHRDKIFMIEECGEKGEAEYRVKRLNSDGPWHELINEGGTLKPGDGAELTGFAFDEDEWRGSDDFYIYRSDRSRRPPEIYLLEYKRILDHLPKLSNYEFIWLASMSDLVLDDFRSVADNLRGYDVVSSRTNQESIEVNEADSDIKIGRSDIEPEAIRKLFRIDKNWNPRVNAEEYRVFSEWIKREYLFAEEPRLESWIDSNTYENYVLPVWFTIDGETEKRFSNRDPEVLKGSRYLMARLRGERLGRHYPGQRGLALNWITSDGDTVNYPSESEMAYQVLKHRQRNTE